ncbi:unnamed protein product [Effrenium voratum]|nr:unnamed protein product [Effrenium voratum]
MRWTPAAIGAVLVLFARAGPGLNRLLLDQRELNGRAARLPMSDRRAVHVAKVLQLRDGETLRCGVLDGGFDDSCSVKWCWEPVAALGRKVIGECLSKGRCADRGCHRRS